MVGGGTGGKGCRIGKERTGKVEGKEKGGNEDMDRIKEGMEG